MDWNEHLREGECAVFLSDVGTDAEMTADGVPRPANKPSVCLVFESQSAAAEYCERRVAEIERLRCDLYDRRGRGVPAIASYVNPKYASRLPNRRTARLILLGAVACFPASLPLFWWDWRTGGVQVFPTLLGITFILTGIRLLFWGVAEMGHAKRRELQEVAIRRAEG